MKMSNKFSAVFVVAVAIMLGLIGSNAYAADAPDLGVAAGYSVFGNAGITETGGQTSNLWGDAGDNGLGHVSLIDSQVDGILFDVSQPTVVSAISAAYGDLSQPITDTVDLTTTPTVGPGVYDITVSPGNAFTSTLTLDGPGVYIFRSTSDIVQTAGGTMLLTNGACASDVFWQVQTAMTFAAAGNIEGTIIANTIISFVPGVTLKGRAWAGTQVTMDDTQITEPTTCAVDEADEEDEEDRDVDIEVTKTADPSVLSSGPGSVTYTYKVRNEGNVSLKNISVSDDKCSPVKYISGDGDHDSKLDTDERWLYTCTKVVSQTETNKVTAKGTNGKEVSDTDTAKVIVSVPGFPNAGIGPNGNTWNINILIGIFITLLSSFYLARKKLAI